MRYGPETSYDSWKNTQESFINETKLFYEVGARPFYSGTGRALVMVVYSELRYGLKDVGRAGDI